MSEPVLYRPRPRALSVVTAVIVVVFGILGYLGLPSWMVIVVASVPWLVLLRECFSTGAAVASVILVDLWLILSLTMLTAALRLPMLATVLTVWIVLGIVGANLCARLTALKTPSIPNAMVWLPALAGPVAWFCAMIANDVMLGSAKLSWVMRGDSANNVLFAREIIYHGGIGVGINENPVPLPPALMAISMASGRPYVPSAALLRHDVEAFAQVWVLLIALTCLLAGVAAAAITRAATERPVIIGVVSAAASLLPLSWLFTGYPLEYGFFSTHVALPIVFAAFIASLSSWAHPRLAFGLMCLAASLLLAVWSPLVLIPACLALVIAVQQRKAILASRGAALVWLVATTGQLVAYGLGVVLPGLFHLRGFLKAQGEVYVFPHSVIVIIGVALIVLSFVAFHSLRSAEWTAILAMVAASALGLTALLFVTRHEPDPWTYYPLKFSWMASVLLLVLLVGVVPAALAPLFRRAAVRYAAIALVTATAVTILAAAPPSYALHEWSNPIKRILNGEVSGMGDAVSETILRDADLEHPHVFWQSKAPQQDFINFWLLEIAANSMTKSNDLRVFAYGVYDETKVRDLCSIMKLMGGAVTVVTANPNLDSGVDGACSNLRAKVVVRSWR